MIQKYNKKFKFTVVLIQKVIYVLPIALLQMTHTDILVLKVRVTFDSRYLQVNSWNLTKQNEFFV